MIHRALLATFAILVSGLALAQEGPPTRGGAAPATPLTPSAAQPAPIKKYYEELRKQIGKTTAKTKEQPSAARKAEKGGAVGATRDLLWEEDLPAWQARQKAAVGPKKLEAGISDVHVVQPGDTLWELSSRYMNSPWLWPRVWSYNPQITNPHWIYPGQVIRFAPRRKPQAKKATPQPRIAPVVKRFEPAQEGVKIFRHTSFISRKLLERLGRIENSQKDSLLFSRFDEVYARFRQPTSVRVGDRFIAARVGRKVEHPVTGKEMGYLVHLNGELKVKTTGSNRRFFTAVVGQTWRPVERGNVLLPWEKLRVPLDRETNTVNLRAYIIAAVEETLLGQYQLAFIDRGSRHGVKVGNMFSVVRRGDGALRLEQYEDKLKRIPVEEVAQIIVLSVRRGTCTGVVRRGKLEVAVGDKVLMRRGE